jgi:KDO2-lipid IV(A) lauroyltransferase
MIANEPGMGEKPDTGKTLPTPTRRKAWRFARKAAPPLRDLLGGPKARRAFLRYWVTDNLWNLAHLATFFLLSVVPVDGVSRFGAALGRFAIPRFHATAAGRARETMARLRPTFGSTPHPEDEALWFDAYCAAQGSLMTEFSALTRIARRPERISIVNIEAVRAAADRGPVIMAGMHLGNWEILPIVLATAGIAVHSTYVPPAGRAKAWIASHVRRKLGVRLLSPGVQGMRPALNVLKQGGAIVVFCDEAFGGKIRGPFFGRPAHLEGNLGLAVRLARLTGATICPWYSLRGDGFRFTVTFLPPLTLPREKAGDLELAEDAERLNAAIEPVIAAHCEQWFFVDSALPQAESTPRIRA